MSDDPMADFLAREKAALGDDADFFNNPQSSTPAPAAPQGQGSGMDMDDFDSFDAPASAKSPVDDGPKGIDAFPSLDNQAPTSEVRVTGFEGLGEDEDREKFESAFPDLSGEIQAPAAQKPVYNALSSQPYGQSPYPARPASSAGGPGAGGRSSVLPAPQFNNILPTTEEDTEPIKAWRAKQQEEIKRRDEEDQKRRDEMSEKAEKWIDGFYEDYNKVKERSIRENKENEASYLEKLNESIAKGTSWERVTELIQLENSQSKTIRPSVPGGSDLARMKEILLSLKREGDKAPGAAGF